MKKVAITTSSLALLVSGCIGVPTGTLNNQGALGEAYVENQAAQIAYGSQERLENVSQSFRNAVPTMINFEFNSSVLDAEAKRVLTLQAEWIKRFPRIRFTVYGHTDLVGSNGYNHALGLRRARNAVNFMVSRGVSRKQLQAVVSKGETQPLVASPGPERLNRRTITDVSGWARGFVGTGMDGKRALIVYNEYVNDEGSEIVAAEE